MGPDCQKGFLAMKLQILRLNPDNAERKKPIGISNGCGTFDDDMRVQPAVVANFHVVTDTTEWANGDSFAEGRFGRNDGCGMNHR
jgi:hypothetical protein